jgi:hypothetical protein
MKHLRNILLILCITAPYACDDATKIDGGNAVCEDKVIIKMLKNEQAYIRKGYIEDNGGKEIFYFELTAEHPEFTGDNLFPCNSIPVQYEIENLSVRIGGNVTSCRVGGVDEHIKPYMILTPSHIFELRTIKIDTQ